MDIHQKFTYAIVKDEKGNQLAEDKLVNSKETFEKFLAPFAPSETCIVMESTTVWEYIYTLLESLSYKVKLANPHKLKAIAFAKLKNDKVDAAMLADLLRANLIPESYIPSFEARRLRELTRMRKVIVKQTTQIKNRIHAHLARRGIKLERKTICKQTILFLQEEAKNDAVLKHYLSALKTLEEEVAAINKDITATAKKREDVKLLTTIPGIGEIRAVSIIAEIVDINRFSTEQQLASYAGLVPIVRQSGTTIRIGHLSQQACKGLKHPIVQAALTAVKMGRDNVFKRHYWKLVETKGKLKAECAVAHKICAVIHAVLSKKEPFSYSYSST